jgi:hypothetical protein
MSKSALRLVVHPLTLLGEKARAGAGRQMGGDDRLGGVGFGTDRQAAVETEPADPQEPSADHGEREIVSGEVPGAASGAEHVGGDKAGHAALFLLNPGAT